jgi:hypothetical protein
MSYVKEAARLVVAAQILGAVVPEGLDLSPEGIIVLEIGETLKITNAILATVETAYKNPKEDILRNASSQRKAIQNFHHLFEGDSRVALANAYLEASVYAYRKAQNETFYGIIKKFRKDFPTIVVADTLVNINTIAREVKAEYATKGALSVAETLIAQAKTDAEAEASTTEFLDGPINEGEVNPEELPEGSLDLTVELPTEEAPEALSEEAPQEELPEVAPEPKLSKKERRRLAAMVVA